MTIEFSLNLVLALSFDEHDNAKNMFKKNKMLLLGGGSALKLRKDFCLFVCNLILKIYEVKLNGFKNNKS